MKKDFCLFPLLILLAFLSSSNVLTGTNHAADFHSNFEPVATTIFNDTILDLPDTVYLQINQCDTVAPLCIDIPVNNIFNYQIAINDTSFYQNGIRACNLDTVFSYNYAQLTQTNTGQPISGPYSVQSWQVNGIVFTGDFQTIPDLIDSLNVWDPTGNWLDNGIERIEGGNSSNVYSDLAVFVAQTGVTPILNVNQAFVINGSELNFDAGLTKVTVTSTGPNPVCVDSFFVSVACIQTETILIDTLLPGVTDTFCLDFSELITPFVSIQNNCAADGSVNFNFVNSNTCIEYTTVSPGVDSACIVVCDARGLCDTTIIIVDVIDPNPSRVFETNIDVNVGESGVFCFDTTRLMNVDTFYNICENTIIDNTDLQFDSTTLCLNYIGEASGGVDTFCLVICDSMMVCDTNYVYLRAKRVGPAVIYDTLYINQGDINCIFDLTNLDGPVTQITNYCAMNGPESVDFQLDNFNYCVSLQALTVGQDTACLVFTDNMGNMDTTLYIVDVLAPQSEIIEDDIRIETMVTYCLDTLELGPNVLDTIFICNDFGGEAVSFIANDLSLCIDVTGINADQVDTLCVAICDELLSCDTTTYIFNVSALPVNAPPILTADNDTTDINTIAEITVCDNDTIPGTLLNFFVLPVDFGGAGPNQGTAFITGDCMINYIPDLDSCGTDQFSYVVANEFGSDTVDVTVLIRCDGTGDGDLTIYNGFSPNGDNVNDFFRIDGIQNIGPNILYVYNRWGNRIFEESNYQNTWDGTWEGNELPDGTYYYVLEIEDGQTMSGYVHIHR